ncbi:unnamed protein product [Auanema sp. JU1783]|nr:unnamed protein product [Auanema sp. JU1783]
MAIFAFAVPLILSSITLDIQLTALKGNIFTLLSPERNISLNVQGHILYADNIRISPVDINSRISFSIECLSDASLHFSTSETNTLLHSPSICAKSTGIQIDDATLYGCVINLYQGDRMLVSRLCGNGLDEGKSTSPPGVLQPIYVAEPLEVNEGGSMPLQWKNVYVLPEHSRLNLSNSDIVFSVIEGPQHGQLLLDGQPVSSFTYAHVLARAVIYKHDDSETTHDSFDFQIEINSKTLNFPWLETTTYTLKVRINAVNDAPSLTEASGAQVIKISAKGTRFLTSDLILLSDQDDGPDKVRVQVVEVRGVHLAINEQVVNEFTQRQLINRQVQLVDEGIYEKGLLRLVARDSDSRSQVLALHTISTPIEVLLKSNTGIWLLHHSSAVITKQNLSFSVSVPDLAIHYSLVDLPDHGLLECSPDEGHFYVCSRFSQSQIDKGLVRFRHTSNQNPTHDTFSFQVESGEHVSMIHNFRITFVPMNVKIFNREVFMLNGTEVGQLTRANLFAWTFPKSFSPDKLVYHIKEPPQYGILSRKIGKKSRRIGVSSNFTQQDIDNGLIQYKLHFMHFSIVNDFFLFQVVSPSVSSETQHFEIIFVPSPSSIQLINRTVVLEEGSSVTVTSESLSLSTSDDKHFIFTISIPPSHGQFQIKISDGFKPLGHLSNFTTKDITEERLYYFHSGDESRNDRVYLTAESTFSRGRKIPLWMTFSVILLNDNPPRLIGSHVIQMVERGERILYPYLLNWKDEDVDAASLKFDFTQPIKDVAVLSTVSPYLPMTQFTENDLKEGKIMVRHLGHKTNFSITYTVTDGEHNVRAEMRIEASEPFVRLADAFIQYCCLPGDEVQIDLTTGNLSVSTNLDVRPENILFLTKGSGFLLRNIKHTDMWKPVNNFTQQDIVSGLVAYKVHGKSEEDITVRVADREITTRVEITRRSLGSTLELRKSQPLQLSVGGAVVIDKTKLEQVDGATLADSLWYIITKQPQEGSLVLEKENSTSIQLSVIRFSQVDIDLGRLQYVHAATGSGRDSFEFNISSPHVTKGPYTIYMDIYDHFVNLKTQDLNVFSGSSSIITTQILNVSSSDRDDYSLKITKQPLYGWIVRDSWNVDNISSIESFSGSDLRERRVVYVSDRSQLATRDEFKVIACISQETCTNEMTIDVILAKRNIQSPQLLRNEILRVNGDKALITNMHLDTEDPDTQSESVFFLISKPSNGIIANVNELERPIYNFSQKHVDDNLIAYIRFSNSSNSGGFSFLLSDGVHQIGPEWFSIESWATTSPVLETNSRLIAAPQSSAVIGVDLLRANLPNTHPNEVLFSIIKPPKHGKIEMDGREITKFSQNDINKRTVQYSNKELSQKDWTRKDAFSFVVSRNGSGRPIEHEFRFRISSTYAAVNDDLSRFVTVKAITLSKGGSIALNSSHLNLDELVTALENESLVIEVGKKPRFGSFEWLDGSRGVVSVDDFKNGLEAVYRNHGEDTGDDSVMLYVYPVSESTKRSSRLRITVPIHIQSHRDPLVQVLHFNSVVSVLSSGSTELTREAYLAAHPHVPPQSIVYEIIQSGINGAEIKVEGKRKKFFSQEEINQGLVSVVHIPVFSSISSTDIIVLSVEGHSRALIVKIRPLDLTLENHTTIEYPQGKTYVVLNRSHLGAYTNGDRSRITYKITSGPENGTFYWVAGEKEVKTFTQADIDDGRVLYAQLNMHSYQDAFQFVMANADKDMLKNISIIRVRSLVEVQPVIVESNSLTPLTSSQLNASLLQGSTPRFLLVNPPVYGKITLDPSSDHSALFFTYPDITRGRVYYQAFHTTKEIVEHLELEVRADIVQPARIVLTITIVPSMDSENDSEESDKEAQKNSKETPKSQDVPRLVPIGDQIPVLVLIMIMLTTVLLVICLNRKKKPKEVPPQLTPPRLPPTPSGSISQEKPDLLGSTVFATVGAARGDNAARPPMKSFERGSAATPVSHTPSMKRRHQPTLDYADFRSKAV